MRDLTSEDLREALKESLSIPAAKMTYTGDSTTLDCSIAVDIILTRGEQVFTEVVIVPWKEAKGQSLADVGTAIQREVYETLRKLVETASDKEAA